MIITIERGTRGINSLADDVPSTLLVPRVKFTTLRVRAETEERELVKTFKLGKNSVRSSRWRTITGQSRVSKFSFSIFLFPFNLLALEWRATQFFCPKIAILIFKCNPGKTNNQFITSQSFLSSDVIATCSKRERNELLYTVRSLVMVRNQSPTQAAKRRSLRGRIFVTFTIWITLDREVLRKRCVLHWTTNSAKRQRENY